MRKVKMLVSMAGPEESYVPGDTREVADGVAEEWERLGIAMVVPSGSADTAPVVKKPATRKKRSRK